MDLFGEFAVDPAALKTWRDIKDLHTHFGFSHGPLVSRFPRRWIDEIKDWGRKEFKGTIRISEFTEMIKQLEQYALIPSGRTFSGNREWIQNAIDCHEQTPFARILTCAANANLHADTMDFEDLDGGTLNQFGQCLLAQNSLEFCRATKLLLQNSKNIKFIDPYLNPKNLTTITQMINLANDGKNRLPEIELHTSSMRGRDEVDLDTEAGVFRDGLKANLQKMQRITVYWWRDIQTKEIHPRYLITEKGGVKFDKGFTEPNDLVEREGQFDAVVLKQNMVTEIDNKYRESLTTYECVRKAEV